MKLKSIHSTAALILIVWLTTPIALPGQTFNTLASFNGANGAGPSYMSFVQGRDGNFYGTTAGGGADGDGTVFRITPSGTLTTLHSFDGTDGANPNAGLILSTGGNFYGTTYGAGANGFGTIFMITPSGTLTTLHSFDGTDGANPNAGLIRAMGGQLYGTTYGGGDNGCGVIFAIIGNYFQTVYSFKGTDGANPAAGLFQSSVMYFYGTTSKGLAMNNGSGFKMTQGGILTTLHSFDYSTDGAYPYGALIQATNGYLYGTTVEDQASLFGTIFRISPSGVMTILYRFCATGVCTDGAYPYPALIQATDGNLYGTTDFGGAGSSCAGTPSGCGTVFKITPSGKLTTLHGFDLSDGGFLYSGLLQSTDGSFYGTTNWAGPGGSGTVFGLSVGLKPFVSLVSARDGSEKISRSSGRIHRNKCSFVEWNRYHLHGRFRHLPGGRSVRRLQVE